MQSSTNTASPSPRGGSSTNSLKEKSNPLSHPRLPAQGPPPPPMRPHRRRLSQEIRASLVQQYLRTGGVPIRLNHLPTKGEKIDLVVFKHSFEEHSQQYQRCHPPHFRRISLQTGTRIHPTFRTPGVLAMELHLPDQEERIRTVEPGRRGLAPMQTPSVHLRRKQRREFQREAGYITNLIQFLIVTLVNFAELHRSQS